MKSAGNGGVVQSRLQVLHVHVFLAAQLGARRVAKSGADQHQGGVPVRECPHHTGAAADLTVQPLDHVVGTDAGPMLAGKIAVGQRFLCTIFSDIVCCLLSEWCVVTSFYQSLQAMSSFILFSICATYCTLSKNKSREIPSTYFFVPCTVRSAPWVTLCTYKHEPLRLQGFVWRRRRDSNPRDPLGAYMISNHAPSTN